MNQKSKRKGSKNSDSKTPRSKGNSKRKWKEDRDGRTSDYEYRNKDNGQNDISWYSKYPELLAAAGQLPYPYRPGMEIPLGSLYDGTKYVLPTSYKIPGVLVLNWAPSVGYSTTPTSPASIACKELYARVRAAFSGSLDADPPDFMIYLMALDSIFSYISTLKRLYRITNAYTPQNYQVPQTLGCAVGWMNPATFYNLQRDKMKLFGVINELIHMTEKFICPAVMDVFNRHYWMSDNVYTDAQTANSQIYVFRQAYYYKFAMLEAGSVMAGGLQLVQYPVFSGNVQNVVDQLYDFGKGLIDALAGSDDAYTISGYLRRAFEGVPNFSVALLDYNEQLELMYNEEVLMQIENALSLPDYTEAATAITKGNWNVTQNPADNSIINQPIVTYAASSTSTWYGTMDKVSIMNNVRNDLPTVADSVIATRLKSWLTPLSGSTTEYKVNSGTEVVLSMEIVDSYVKGSTTEFTSRRISQYNFLATSGAWYTPFMNCTFLSTFDWAPIVYLASVGSGSNPSYYLYPFWDLHNVTVVDSLQLEQLNRVCIYSEFNAFNI